MADQPLDEGKVQTIVLDSPEEFFHEMSRPEKEAYVLKEADSAGRYGVTVHDIQRLTGQLLQSVSGILTRLKSRGALVQQTYVRRLEDGHEVAYKFVRKSPTGGRSAVLVTPAHSGKYPMRPGEEAKF